MNEIEKIIKDNSIIIEDIMRKADHELLEITHSPDVVAEIYCNRMKMFNVLNDVRNSLKKRNGEPL